MRVTSHASEKIRSRLKMSVDQFFALVNKADDPTDPSVRWTTRNMKNARKRPGLRRMYVEELQKTFSVVICDDCIVTVYDPQEGGGDEGTTAESRYSTFSRFLRDNGFQGMSRMLFDQMEGRIVSLTSVQMKRFRVGRNKWRFPVEGGGKKFFVICILEGQQILSLCYPTKKTKLDHTEEPIFVY